MGVAWHGNYFATLKWPARRCSTSSITAIADERVRLFVASGRCAGEISPALTFEQRIRVRAHIEEFENRCGLAIRFSMPKRANAPPPDNHSGRGRRAKSRTVLCQPRYLFERMGVKP